MKIEWVFRIGRAAIFCLLCTVCICYPTFDEYCLRFQKSYSADPKEYARRAEIYNKKIQMFEKAKGYTPGVNKMTDWTDEEIAKLKNGRNPFATGLKFAKMDIDPVLASSRQGRLGLSVPASLNWTANGKVTSVKDQGQCGSCWAFGTIGQAESYAILYKNFSVQTVDFAEQQLVQCVSDYGCDGAYNMALPMQQIVKGVVNESKYHYKADATFYASTICTDTVTKLANAYELYGVSSDNALVSFLQAGPVAVMVSANNDWDSYQSGVVACSPADEINHVVLLVGYTSTYWILKNQWSTDWGENGYIRTKKGGTNEQSCFLRSGVMRLKIDCQVGCQVCLTTTQCAYCFDPNNNILDANGKCNCPTGKQFSTATNTCVNCFGGKTWINGTCACPTGKSWNGTTCSTTNCTGGQTWNTTTLACACSTGSNWNGTACVSCTGGRTWNTTTLTCACPTGSNWNGTACVSCTGGRTWNPTYLLCLCPSNSYWTGSYCFFFARSSPLSSPRCSPPQYWNGLTCTLMPALLSISIEVDLDFDQFSWEIVPHLKEILGEALGAPYVDSPELINIIGFRKGSVIIDAQIKAESDQQVEKVRAQLADTKILLGAPVQSVTAKLESSERIQQSPTGRLSSSSLIIAIAVGSAVLLIIALIIVKFACFKAKAAQQLEGRTLPQGRTLPEGRTHTQTEMQIEDV